MKKQIKKIGLLFSLVLVAFVSFGLANVNATENTKTIQSVAIYKAVLFYPYSTNLTTDEVNTIKGLSDQSTYTLVIPTNLAEKITKITLGNVNPGQLVGVEIADLENFPNLEELAIYMASEAYKDNGVYANEIDLSAVSKFTKLKKFTLDMSHNTSEGINKAGIVKNLDAIKNCTNLETIYFDNIYCKSIDFSIFENMKSLKELTIGSGTRGYAEKSPVVNFNKITNLTSLEKASFTGLKNINSTKTLENLVTSKKVTLTECCVDDSDITEDKEYILPTIIKDMINQYSSYLKVSGGTISEDRKKVTFGDSVKSGDKITIEASYPKVPEGYDENTFELQILKMVITYNSNTYEYIEGKAQTYTLNSGKGATFRIDADYSLFKNGGKVFVDNKEVASKFITSKEGSTIITLAEEFLKTLKAGQHEIKVVFSNNVESKAGFVVAEQKTETKTETNTNANTNTSGTSTTNTSASKPTDYKSNPDTGIIRLSYADLSVTNVINF